MKWNCSGSAVNKLKVAFQYTFSIQSKVNYKDWSFNWKVWFFQSKPLLKIGSVDKAFFVLILTTAKKSVWNRISWILTKFQLNQTTDRKNYNSNCLNKLNQSNFCEVSWNSISNRCWKFQLSLLKNKKVLFETKKKKFGRSL